VKLNTDAGFCPLSGKASTGIVVRDTDGQALLTAWRSLQHCRSPEEAEAEACLEGMRLVAEWIRQPTCVESDCLSLTNALNNGAEARAGWAGISEIQAIGTILPECTFRHIRKDANKVAHSLAQQALSRQGGVVMRHGMPECVRRQVEVEAAEGIGPTIPCNSTIVR
jgi:ribonuclease HI